MLDAAKYPADFMRGTCRASGLASSIRAGNGYFRWEPYETNNERRLRPASHAGSGNILWTGTDRKRGYRKQAICARAISGPDFNGLTQRGTDQKRARPQGRAHAGQAPIRDYDGPGDAGAGRVCAPDGVSAQSRFLQALAGMRPA